MADIISKPTLASSSGYGYSSGAQVDIPIAPKTPTTLSLFTNELLPTVAATMNKMVDNAKDQAFMQGQADQYSGMIQDQSWMTKQAYDQGVNFQKYSEYLSDVPDRFMQAAKQSAQNYETVEQYNQRISPILADVNSYMGNLGLLGKAKEAAQKQFLSLNITAQDTYQKAREEEGYRMVDTGMANIAASAARALGNVPNLTPDVVIQNMSAAYSAAYELASPMFPKQAADMASKNAHSILQIGLAQLNPANPSDLDKLKAYDAYLRSPEAAQIQPDILGRAMEAVNKKYDDVRKAQKVYDDDQVRELELQVAEGKDVDTKQIYAMQQQARDDMRSGRKDPEQAEAYINKLHEIQKGVVKDQGKQSFLLSAQSADLDRNGYTKEEQTKAVKQAVAKQYGSDYTKASISAINFGIQQRNMGTIKAGAEIATSQFIPAFAMTKDELVKANDGQQGAAFRGFVDRYRAAGAKGAVGMQAALLEAIPQDDRAAFEVLLRDSSNTAIDLRTAAPQLQVIKQQLKDFQSKGGAYNVKISADDFKSKFWFGGSSATGGASIGHQPQDTVLVRNQGKFQSVLESSIPDLQHKGYVIHDSKSAMQAMIRENYALVTPSGPVAINPNWVKAVGIKDGVSSNNEVLAGTIDKLRAAYASKKKIKADDVYAEVRGTTLVLQGYNSDGVHQQEVAYAPNVIKNLINDDITQQAKKGRKLEIGVASTGKSVMPITSDWGVPFKNNEFGTALGQHLARMEGYVSSARVTDPRYTTNRVVGIGINIDANPKWAAEASAAASNPIKMGEVTGRFAKEHYANWKNLEAATGLPPLNSVLGKRYWSAYLGLGDATWHGSTNGGMQYAKALRLAASGNVTAGLGALQQTAFYKQSGPDRKKFLEHGVRSVVPMP